MLVMLPGLICDASIYAPQTAAFRGSRAVDGYGLCNTLEGMARHALDHAPDRFDLFGHSMGGRVALEIVRIAPERVQRLALVSTGIHPTKSGEREKREALRDVGRKDGMEALIDAWLPPMVSPDRADDEALMAPLRAMCMRAGMQVFEAQIEALLTRPDVEGLLPTISCPTLVMTGENDSWSGPAQHEAIATTIPNSELVIVPGAGHMIQLEAPEAVNTAITNWLNRPVND